MRTNARSSACSRLAPVLVLGNSGSLKPLWNSRASVPCFVASGMPPLRGVGKSNTAQRTLPGR
eukprot:3060530-Lingulodinium_polyedra.AAC.1